MIGFCKTLTTVLTESSLKGTKLDGLVRCRLGKVLLSAADNVPYYSELMQKAGFVPGRHFTQAGDIQRLPVTKRSDLNRAGAQAIIDRRIDPATCHCESTSGSSGIPLKVCRSSKERNVQIAKWLRVLLQNGYRPWQRVLAYVHTNRVVDSLSLVQRMGLFRRWTVDYYRPLDDQIASLLEVRPHVIYGNRCHLELMAMECLEKGTDIRFLEFVVLTGEVVHAGSRRIIEQAFNARVLESYGSVEMGVMGHEVPGVEGLTLCEDRTVFEFLDDDDQPVPPDTPGRVVVTDLTNTVQPFIRFDQGDLAEFKILHDSNGTSRRLITRIYGRDDDFAIFPDGSRRSYLDICGRLRDMTEIQQYRIVQLEPSRFLMEIVTRPDLFNGLQSTLRSHFRELFPGLHFEIRAVQRIAPEASGKIRKFISRVDVSNTRPGDD